MLSSSTCIGGRKKRKSGNASWTNESRRAASGKDNRNANEKGHHRAGMQRLCLKRRGGRWQAGGVVGRKSDKFARVPVRGDRE